MFVLALLLTSILSLAIQLSQTSNEDPDALPPIVVNDPNLQVEWAIAPRFDSFGSFKDGIAGASRYDESGYINQQGEFVIPLQFEDTSQFREGLARVKLNGKYGYIDKNGEIVIEPQFSKAHHFSEGIAFVALDREPPIYAAIDKNGQILFKLPPRAKAEKFVQGWAVVERDYQWGYLDKSGKLAIVPRFHAARDFSEGLAAVKLTKSLKNSNWGHWGFIDRAGHEVIKLPFESVLIAPDAADFSEGLAVVRRDEKYGYIDKSGKVVIPIQFDVAYKFKGGLAIVRQHGKSGYIDQTGKFAIPPKFDWAYEFTDGLAGAGLDGKGGYINKKGEFVIAPQFDVLFNFREDLAAVQYKGKFGYIRKSSKPES